MTADVRRSTASASRSSTSGRPSRLKALEDENAKPKKLLAEAVLDNATLRDVAARKW